MLAKACRIFPSHRQYQGFERLGRGSIDGRCPRPTRTKANEPGDIFGKLKDKAYLDVAAKKFAYGEDSPWTPMQAGPHSSALSRCMVVGLGLGPTSA